MSIIPASALTASDLARLGNNVSAAGLRHPRPRRPDLRAVKGTIFVAGRAVEELRGGYGPHALRFLAGVPGVEYCHAIGPGSAAQNTRAAVHGHFRMTPPSPAA